VARASGYTPLMQKVISNLSGRGLKQTEIAELCGISASTLKLWVKAYPDLRRAIRDSKCVTEELGESALIRSALGQWIDDVKVFYDNKTGEVVTHKYKKYIAPNQKSIEFLLKNLNPERWKDIHEVTLENKDGTVDSLREAQKVLSMDPTLLAGTDDRELDSKDT